MLNLFCLCQTDVMLWLCLLNEPPEPFVLSHVLLRMSSIRMRRTSLIEWPAWLKCSDIGVALPSCLVIQDRTSVFPKAFTELTLGLSDVLMWIGGPRIVYLVT